MATTFDVISLGQFPTLDPYEGNATSENASLFTGMTFGSPGNELYKNIHSFSPSGIGYDYSGWTHLYDTDNHLSNDQFSIDGGPSQTFDAVVIYNATITYSDSTTATITAVIFQDTDGHTYLAPEYTAGSDADKLSAKPIQSLTLDSIAEATDIGLLGDRHPGNFMVCFADGTLIQTPKGPRKVETLVQGDLVVTLDRGPQPIRWIGVQHRFYQPGQDDLVVIEPGALGQGTPKKRLRLSRQHRVFIRSRIAQRMFGSAEVLLPAHRLVGCPGIYFSAWDGLMGYWHFLCDQHELVFANHALTESLLMGDQAHKQVGRKAIHEIADLDPCLLTPSPEPARPIPHGRTQSRFVHRVLKNKRPLVENVVNDQSTTPVGCKAAFLPLIQHPPSACAALAAGAG